MVERDYGGWKLVGSFEEADVRVSIWRITCPIYVGRNDNGFKCSFSHRSTSIPKNLQQIEKLRLWPSWKKSIPSFWRKKILVNEKANYVSPRHRLTLSSIKRTQRRVKGKMLMNCFLVSEAQMRKQYTVTWGVLRDNLFKFSNQELIS